MYRCEKCNQVSRPREKMHKRVFEKQDKKYYVAIFHHKRNGRKTITQHVKPTKEELEKLRTESWELTTEKEMKGWEIVSEIKLCDKCAKELDNESNNSR